MPAHPPLRVAFATCHAIPDITDDDDLLRAELETLGVTVDARPWDTDVDWGRYDAVLPRSTWDYHLRLREFDAWLSRVDASGTPLVNPLRVLRWNMTKRYLAQLAACDIRVVPTAWVAPAMPTIDTPSLADIAGARGWHDAIVIKPVVSASARDTWISRTRSTDDECRFRAALARAHDGLMVQPFLPEIQHQGEWSLIFIGGEFGHAVVKRPAAGDFRVQLEHGGAHEPHIPPAQLVRDAARVVHAAAECAGVSVDEIRYARIDGIVRDGRLVLMECEALEPALHFATHPASASALAAGIYSAAMYARR